ncbi:MAG: energy transducer TonB [Alistipes sp.]|jgi:TonB family protein|nr:energy transducer TonB [Alistipes sp.]
MEYYDPIDRSSRRIAAVVTPIVMALLAGVMSLVSFDVNAGGDTPPPVEIIFEEEPLPTPEPKPARQQSAPTDQRRDKAPAHEKEAKSESSNQTAGEAEKTETVNPNALFKPVTGNSAEQVPVGNRLAPDGEKEQNKGEGTGYNLQGTDQLDEGLQGRGLREGLPKPSKNYKTAGIVVVYVTIDSNGSVQSAEVNLQGTTTADATLHDLALKAARKAKFRASERTLQGGTITYEFKLE